MDEDEEDFYDSLDEDQNVEDVRQIIQTDSEIKLKEKESDYILYKSECSTPKKVSKEKTTKKEIVPQKTTKIPLYVGETYKEDLKINIKPNPNVYAYKTPSTCISCETVNKSNRVKFDNVVSKKKLDSSYWTIYCQKNGIPFDDDTQYTDSDRGCSTNRTFSTFISGSCLNGNTWDAPSLFEKYMPKTYAAQKNDLVMTFHEENSERSSKCDSISTEVFRSVSQIDIRQTPPSRTSNKIIMRSRSNTSNLSALKPLSLKSMSPDETKLELIKKQQEYGLRASTRNRAKIIQNLSKMKQDIQERRQRMHYTH